MFGRSKAIVGLDIGSSAVKAVELKAAGKGYKVAAFGSEPIPPDSIVDGAIIDGGVVLRCDPSVVRAARHQDEGCGRVAVRERGDGDGRGHGLQSDVQSSTGGVFEDQGTLTARLALKDPGTSGSPTTPTSANFITINRYRVVYVRTDGGAVPLPFEGAMTFTVTGGAAVAASFVLVRVSAKLQAPLISLRAGGSSIAIYTVADVTFFGRDQTGRETIATGRISVNFADWAG